MPRLTRNLPKRLPTQNKQRHSEFLKGRDLFPGLFRCLGFFTPTAKTIRRFTGIVNGLPKADKLFSQLKSNGLPKADKPFSQLKSNSLPKADELFDQLKSHGLPKAEKLFDL